MAVAEASFKTSIDSMSLGFKEPMLDVSCGKPSMTYKGAVLWVNEPAPRITILKLSPRPPSVDETCTPAIRPPKDSATLLTGVLVNSLMSALAMEPVRSLRRTSPYPTATTTTSCSCWASSVKLTVNFFWLFTGISCV